MSRLRGNAAAISADGRTTFTSSELARLTGVSTDTLRHYERKRVLPPPRRSANGYRRYPADAVTRVQLVQRALRVGFSLDELARSLGERERGGTPCRRVRALVAERLADLEARIRDLVTLRGEMQQLLREWDDRLAAAPAGQQARLLDLLGGLRPAESPTPISPFPAARFRTRKPRG